MGKKYYWIKLKTDFFNQEIIDFLLSQENGCKYIVLYQMLCLNTANNNGKMCSKIGEMIIPYDIDKIVRDTKYFEFDTVAVALELFKKLGLIYEEENKIFKITNYDEMVGSECSSAKRVREYRERKNALQCNKNVTQEIEYRDRDRDKSIEIDIDKEINKKETEVCQFVKEGYSENYKNIIDYLNLKAKTNFRATSEKTQRLIKARLNENYTIDDFKRVIDIKCYEWLNNKDMAKYLRPETLFGTKFESYLNQRTTLTTNDIANKMDWSDY